MVDCQSVDGVENPSLKAFRDVYLQRFPDRAKDLEKFIAENILAISNKFQDTWFWGKDVFSTISKELLSVHTFFQGPTVVTKDKTLLFA